MTVPTPDRLRAAARPLKANIIAVPLPDRLERAVRLIAKRARTTRAAVVAEAVHERLARVCESMDAAQTRRGRK
jgi:predicted transcriptional regulator